MLTPEQEIALYEEALKDPGRLTVAKLRWASHVMSAWDYPLKPLTTTREMHQAFHDEVRRFFEEGT